MEIETQLTISVRDWRILEKVIPKYISHNMDIENAFELLCSSGYITEDEKQKIESVCRLERTNKTRILLFELFKVLDFNDIVRFLRHMGQHSFANELLFERNKEGGVIVRVHGADTGVRVGIFTYYNNFKSQLDDNIFSPDRISELTRRSAFLKGAIIFEENISRKQCFVDRYAAVTYLLVAQYRDRDERIKILDEMKNTLPTDVDGTFTYIIYQCKKAVTEMHAGNDEIARVYMGDALTKCDGCQQQFVKAFLFHDLQFISRISHSCSFSEKDLKETISGGDLGLLFMQEELDESAQIWSRVYLSENAMGLLKIRSNFKVRVGERVSDIDIRHAEKLLEHLKLRQGTLEIRRKMIYCLCQARINELRGRLQEAKDYARRASELAEEGVHFANDKSNIDEYYAYLCSI